MRHPLGPANYKAPDPDPRAVPFLDLVTDGWCELVVPPGGKVYPEASEPKIGVAHPRCNALADLAIELDAFFCAACHRNGRISGAWCLEVIEEAGSP